jgi:hypothetical protein
MMFNELESVKILEETGFTRKQSEVLLQIFIEFMEEKFATRQDFLILSHEFQLLRQEFQHLRQDFAHFKEDIRKEIRESEYRMTIRMGSMLAASIALVTALNKLI